MDRTGQDRTGQEEKRRDIPVNEYTRRAESVTEGSYLHREIGTEYTAVTHLPKIPR